MRKKADTEAGVRTASIRSVVNASEFRRLATTQTQGTETDAGSKDIRYLFIPSFMNNDNAIATAILAPTSFWCQIDFYADNLLP